MPRGSSTAPRPFSRVLRRRPKPHVARAGLRAGLAVFVLFAGCDHTAPFRPGDYGPAAPAFSGSLRLTYNPGLDWMPAWLADGSGILYSLQRLDRDDLDRCLGILPPGGGTLVRVLCHRVPAADDSTDVLEAAAAREDGRVALVRASSPLDVPSLSPRYQALVVTTLDRVADHRVLRTIPYTPDEPPGAQPHDGVSQIHWIGDSTLAYVAERVAYPRPCSGCAPDTLRWGLAIATIAWDGAAARVSEVAGTIGASSLALGASPDTLYYTVNGDSRVYARALATGATAVVHDFGAGRIARDITLRGNRLVGVVGGDVAFTQDPVLGSVQRDAGGPLVLVDLAAGTETPLGAGGSFRRPRFSPAGTTLVVERWDASSPDLWLLAVP